MERQPKEIPDITWKNIIPPFKDHVYFQYGEQRPFESLANGYSPVNAWWLSEAALLAYADEAFVQPRFLSAGFDRVWFFSGPSTQCYLAVAADFATVVFRGTESDLQGEHSGLAQFVADLKADLDIRLVDWDKGGKVHSGFHNALDEIWVDLLAQLRKIHTQNRSVWVTGHSLGAALATLAAGRYGQVQGLYTFGSPRVGDRNFKAGFQIPTFRFANNNDVVCQVPPSPYVHVGQMRYIDRQGSIHTQVAPNRRWVDEIRGHLDGVMESLRHSDMGLAALLPDGLRDHTPLLYALHCWNDLVRGQG